MTLSGQILGVQVAAGKLRLCRQICRWVSWQLTYRICRRVKRGNTDHAKEEGPGGRPGSGHCEILILRGRRVILDRGLAHIYGVETRALNQAVKRNADRFPDDFRFRLTSAEAKASRSPSVMLNSRRGQNTKFLPYAFTEHGAIMVATVLASPRAVEMSIYVVRAFVQLRELLSSNKELAKRLDELEARIEKGLATHDEAITAMLSAIRELMSGTPAKRRGIGFTADLGEQR